MKTFIFFVISLALVIGSANSQTTVNGVSAGGYLYNITYRDNVTFSDYQTAMSSNGSTNFAGNSVKAPWWQGSAKDFADAMDVSNVRFAYDTVDIGGVDYALYMTTNNAGSQASSPTASASYAISAVEVPAPLPILGILPVVGFLKRMRKRQRA